MPGYSTRWRDHTIPYPVTHKLFVYGTLRPPKDGVPASDWRYYPEIADLVLDRMPGRLESAVLYDLGAYPALRPGDSIAHGDLLTLHSDALAIADRIEGHPEFFQRTWASIITDSGVVDAWVYWAPEAITASQPVIINGDWFYRRKGATEVPKQVQSSPDEQDPALLECVRRFASANCSWLSTVRPDGKAHLSPMWHVWYRGRAYMVASGTSVKVTNISVNPSVSVSHPDPSDVIVIEGWALATDLMEDSIRPLFLEKYGWDIATDVTYNTVIEITPLKLMAWHNSPAMRWTGADVLQIW